MDTAAGSWGAVGTPFALHVQAVMGVGGSGALKANISAHGRAVMNQGAEGADGRGPPESGMGSGCSELPCSYWGDSASPPSTLDGEQARPRCPHPLGFATSGLGMALSDCSA